MVLGNEFSEKIQKLKSSNTKTLNSELEIEKTKSKLLSLILLLIASGSFVYLIYFTDKESREKNQDQIIAAKKISKTEIDLKNKISEQLHDNIGGSLVALKMRLSLINDLNYYKALRSEINNLELIYN